MPQVKLMTTPSTFRPKDQVVYLGTTHPELGISAGETYEVIDVDQLGGFNGLQLKGVVGFWNPLRFKLAPPTAG